MNESPQAARKAVGRRSPPPATSASKIEGLDGLRGIAVTMVVVTHLGLVSGLNETEYLRSTFMPLVAGYTGVHIFFVLSGFLITLLLVREHQKNGRISVSSFFIRRILRIFPVYFLVVGLTIFVGLIGTNVLTPESVPFLLTYTYNFIPNLWYSSTVGHTWSLAVEEHFYLVWPFVFIFLAARYPRRLPLFTAGVFVLSLVLWEIASSIDVLDRKFIVERWSFVAGGFIALGATVALLVEWSERRDMWRRLLRGPIPPAVGLALFFNSLFVDLGYYGGSARGIGVALLIGWIYLNQRAHLVAGLELPPLRYIGRISYGIYMWQGFFLATGPDRLPGQTWPPDTWTGFILLAVVAPLSYHGFEQPLLRLKARFQPGTARRKAKGYEAPRRAPIY